MDTEIKRFRRNRQSSLEDRRPFGKILSPLPSLIAIAFCTPVAATTSQFFIPVAAMNDQNADDGALETCLNSAKAVGGTCVVPAGELIITHYPSPLRQQNPSTVVSLGGATLRGQGPGTTTIKGKSEDGFDVLQLNAVSNFVILDLSITAVVTGELTDHGVNGISMTNGTNNIRIKNVHVFGLPYLQETGTVNGGKAFTVQTGDSNHSIQMRDIYVEQCSSSDVLAGFWMDADTNSNVEPDNINVIGNTFEGYLAGIVFGFVFPVAPMQGFSANIVDNAVYGGKYGIALVRGRGYYLKGNYVVLRDDLYRTMDSGDFIDTRQNLYFTGVTYLTVELTTFELTAGDHFLRAEGADEARHLVRHNNFYGGPASPTHLTNASAGFNDYFNAAGTFY